MEMLHVDKTTKFSNVVELGAAVNKVNQFWHSACHWRAHFLDTFCKTDADLEPSHPLELV